MIRKSTRINYDRAPVTENDRENPYDNLFQYHPDILERSPANIAIESGPRTEMAKLSAKQAKARSIMRKRSKAKGEAADKGDNLNELDKVIASSPTYSAIIRYSDGKGGYIRKRAQIELPYMVIFMQAYLDDYNDLIQALLIRQNDRPAVEELLQELLHNYHGLLMSEYRSMFYTMLTCAPRVLFSMLRFEFWRDLLLKPHDLVAELDLHRQLRQYNDEYNQMVMEYTDYANRVKRFVARTKFYTIKEAERLQRLARYQRLIRQNKPIPKSLLQALAQDEQELLSEEKRQQDNIERRHYAALKNDYQQKDDDDALNESYSGEEVPSQYDQFLAALSKNEDEEASLSSPEKTGASDVDLCAALDHAATGDDYEDDEYSDDDYDDYEDADFEYDDLEDDEDYDPFDESQNSAFSQFSPEFRAKVKAAANQKKHRGAKPRQHKGKALGNATIKAKGTRNLNSSYILLQKLATTKTTGPIDGRGKRDNLPKLGRGHYRRVPLPQTYEIRRDIDHISAFLEHDRELMFSSLMSLVTNQSRLKAVFGDNFKRFNLEDPRFVDIWLNLETMDQPCMVLFVGSLVEVRPHNTKRSVYNASLANRNFITIDGLDFRVGSMASAKNGKGKGTKKKAAAPKVKPHIELELPDDSLDDPNALNRINIIKEDQLTPYELIYIKL